MKRSVVVGTGTIIGIAAVLALNPDGGAVSASSLPALPHVTPNATSGNSSSGNSSSGNSSSGNSSSGNSSSGNSSSGNSGSNNSNSNNSGSGNSAVSKKVTGASIDVGYGLVQVQAVVKGGKLVDVTAVALPNNDNHSARISEQAFPMLVQQALQAQSSNISGISGASYTSYGFVKSLESALSQAGLKG